MGHDDVFERQFASIQDTTAEAFDLGGVAVGSLALLLLLAALLAVFGLALLA